MKDVSDQFNRTKAVREAQGDALLSCEWSKRIEEYICFGRDEEMMNGLRRMRLFAARLKEEFGAWRDDLGRKHVMVNHFKKLCASVAEERTTEDYAVLIFRKRLAKTTRPN